MLQERLHYETLSQHLGKLGEDAGKMVHRVIDLTRPEDLDGRLLCAAFMSLSCFSITLFGYYWTLEPLNEFWLLIIKSANVYR